MAYELIIPTAINILNRVNSNIVDNLRRGKSANLELPSLYRLAYMVVNNTGEIVVSSETVEEE